MASRISPLMWPLVALASPVLVPKFLWRNRTFKANRYWAAKANRQRIDGAPALELPALDFLDLTVLVDEKTKPGFRGDAGVSYLITTNRGTVLFDVGFGPESPTLAHNVARLGVDIGKMDAVAVSHLHPDHMGGMAAFRSKSVRIPPELSAAKGKPCYLPDKAETEDFDGQVVEGPQTLAAGIGTTGPLARSLFFLGLCEEQALVARLQGQGLVVVTGCGLREIAAAGHATVHQHTTGWSLWIGTGLISLGVAVSLLASFEYFRFVQLAKRGLDYMPRTAMLAVVVSVILAILRTVMAVYLILLGA